MKRVLTSLYSASSSNVQIDNHAFSPWRAPLFAGIATILVFLFLSGFEIFFLGSFLSHRDRVGLIHWLLGLVASPVIILYLWQHYQRVRLLSRTLRFATGMAVAIALAILLFGGIPLIGQRPYSGLIRIIDLIHIMAGFAFGIIFTVHLVLVARAGVLRNRSAMPRPYAQIVRRLTYIFLFALAPLICLSLF